MGNYNLSSRAQYDLVGMYKYGIKFFGPDQATKYLLDLEGFLEELAERPELAKDASTIADSLKYYSYKAHVIFYQFDHANEIFIIRILGKRMNFIEHL
ncbi:MAG: type II toxin-antitoxin system RelE/ParE family toxin [Arenibacter algicola]